MHYNVHSSTVYNSQEMEVTSMSTNGWINREDVVYMHNRIWKEWKNVICRNKEKRKNYHVKWRKSDREREISYNITSMWNLKNKQTNKKNRCKWTYLHNRLTGVENQLMVTKEEKGSRTN